MCGIIGYTGKKPFNQRIIELLIAWNSLERGEDATGLYSPQNGLLKTLVKGSYFTTYQQKDYFVPDKLFIGHVRAATVGAKENVNNAHPFKRGPYVLAHNGTLKNHKDLLHKYNLKDSDFTVDSDCVAGCMEACNDIPTVLSEINGAGAFIIYDERKKEKLYLFRNKERPLWRAYDDEGGMYISSIPEPLAFEGLSKIKEFKEDVLYSINSGVISTSRSETRNIKNVPYSKPVTHYNPHQNDNWPEDTEPFSLVCAYNADKTSQKSIGSVVSKNNKHDIFENLWLRCIKDISYYDDFIGRRIDLKEGQWYLMVSDSNILKRLWLNENDEDYYEVDKAWFDLTGIITAKNLVCLMQDSVKDQDDKFVGNKGDIFQVEHIFTDSDLSISVYKDGRYTNAGYIKKKFARKLTNVEKEAYMSELNGKALGLNSTTEITVQQTFTISKDTKDESFEEDEDDVHLEAEDSNVQIIVNEKGVHKFFEGLEKKLKELRDNSTNFTFNDKITDIINYQIAEKDRLINNGINV